MELEPQRLLSSLSDDTRLRIVSLLSLHDELCVCELVKVLESIQPKISKHLGILRSNGLIVGRREGQWVHYRLNPDMPVWASNTISELLQGCRSRSPYLDDGKRLNNSRSASACT